MFCWWWQENADSGKSAESPMGDCCSQALIYSVFIFSGAQWVNHAVFPSRSSFTTKMLRHRTQVVITDILFTTEYLLCIQDPVCSLIWLLPLNPTLIKCINTQKCHTGPIAKAKRKTFGILRVSVAKTKRKFHICSSGRLAIRDLVSSADRAICTLNQYAAVLPALLAVYTDRLSQP